jgi:ribosomal peptide maturation radical SAM protein 1
MAAQRTCLLSLPWDYYQSPSIAIGCLAAFARKKGFKVDALHLHLEAAALFDLSSYDIIAYRFPVVGEALSAMFVMPREKERLLEFAKKKFVDAELCADRMYRVLRSLYQRYEWSRYTVVGFSVHFAQLFSSLLFASWIKQDHPKIRIILGGGCITEGLGISVLQRFPYVDWCHHGEGEDAFVALIRSVREGTNGSEKDIPGLIYRSGQTVCANPKQQFEDFRGWPDPDYNHYFQLRNTHPLLKQRSLASYLPVEVSRGCLYRCAFCNFNYLTTFRARPTSEVASSMRRMSRKYHVHSFCLMALMIPPSSSESFFRTIGKGGRSYRIFCEARANLTKKSLMAMKKAGVTEVQLGIEALNTRLLKKMRKGTRLIDNIQAMKFCEELGIKTNSFFILAFPTETQSEIDKSLKVIDYACGYSPLNQIAPCTLREGSPIALDPQKYGIYGIRRPGLFSDFVLLEEEGKAEFLPQSQGQVNGINYWNLDFKSRRKPRDYRKLMQRIKRWQKSYDNAQASGRPLLYYLDGKDFLTIEDYRDLETKIAGIHSFLGRTIHLLEGWERELYLFCDSIRKFKDIESQFADRSPADIRKTLRRLTRLKIMFHEDECYLSLAVSAGPSNRRNMPFQWF